MSKNKDRNQHTDEKPKCLRRKIPTGSDAFTEYNSLEALALYYAIDSYEISKQGVIERFFSFTEKNGISINDLLECLSFFIVPNSEHYELIERASQLQWTPEFIRSFTASTDSNS